MSLSKLKFVLGCLLISCSVSAQPGSDWFPNNDRGQYYEGSYSRKVSNPSVSLVSLLASPIRYTFGQNQQLAVSFYSDGDHPYELHAEELNINQFYWMQDKGSRTASGRNEFGGWNVDYLLKRLSVEARNLGVLIRLGDRGVRKFAPARIGLDGQFPFVRRYIAQIRLGRSVASGNYRVYTGEKKVQEQLILEQTITAKPSGIVFPIILPVAELGAEPYWITVEINLYEKHTLDPFTYSFSFYHQPNE